MTSFPEIDPDNPESRAFWKQKLTHDQFRVCVERGTERPWSGKYAEAQSAGEQSEGIYHCVCCKAPLFRSDAKFDSGCGWPSYFEPIQQDAMKEVKDLSLGRARTEVRCSQCGSHLGHVFKDGPEPTGLRYCINSVCIELEAD